MAYKIVTQPTSEPVSLEEAKKHLIVDADDTSEDTLIYGCISAARKAAESFLGRSLITQTWDLYLDSFPNADFIDIPFPPLASVTHVKYKATDYGTTATLTTWAATNYIVDTINEPGSIRLAYGISWPTTYGEAQDVQIRFVCGYGNASAVPQNIKQAILLKLTDLYENRGDTERSFVTNTLEQAFEALLWPDRIVPV